MIKIKRYILFCYYRFYPYGGWGDFTNSFDTLEEALKAQKTADKWHIVDLVEGRMIEDG